MGAETIIEPNCQRVHQSRLVLTLKRQFPLIIQLKDFFDKVTIQ